MAISKDEVIDVIKQCYDPEIPIDLWNLGLIYDIKIEDAGDLSNVNIVMSLTTPGCSMARYMADDIKNKLEAHKAVNETVVQITFDPPWHPDMMTEEGKRKLGIKPSQPVENT